MNKQELKSEIVKFITVSDNATTAEIASFLNESLDNIKKLLIELAVIDNKIETWIIFDSANPTDDTVWILKK